LTQQLQGHDRREMLLKKVAPGEVIALHGVGSILETATEVPAGQEKDGNERQDRQAHPGVQ